MLLLNYADNHEDILTEISNSWTLFNLSMTSEDLKEYVIRTNGLGTRKANISSDALNVKLRPSVSQFVITL
jgi:hypothetical protein